MVNLPALKSISVSSTADALQLARQIMQMVSNIKEGLSRLLANQDALSVYQDVSLVATTPKTVGHGLGLKTGQVPQGWAITDIDANTTVCRNAWDDRTITIEAAADCNIKLKVW